MIMYICCYGAFTKQLFVCLFYGVFQSELNWAIPVSYVMIIVLALHTETDRCIRLGDLP